MRCPRARAARDASGHASNTPALTLLCLCLALPRGRPRAAVPHTVQPGETLWSIAAANNLYTGRARRLQRPVARGATSSSARRSWSRPRAEALPKVNEALAAGAPQPSGASTAPAARPRRAARAARSAAGRRLPVQPGDTFSALAARAGVRARAGRRRQRPRRQRAAARGHDDQAAARRRRPCSSRPPRPPAPANVPAGRPGRRARPRDAGRHPRGRRPARRPRLARRGDRLAGERLQQRDGLLGQRARRHAGHAGHVGLGPAQPRPAPARPQQRDRQRPRRHALPRPAAARDRRRPGDSPPPATTRASRSVRKIGMLPETQQYVDNVMALRGRFGG